MADQENIQSEGRKGNAAEPLNASKTKAEPERYPPARRDDGIEARRPAAARTPKQGAGAPADGKR